MIEFILNNSLIQTDGPAGLPLLDYIRYDQNLCGTKIGCREGDCGACTILCGTEVNGHIHYSSATSCLMPLGNAQGKHIVTIEGINMKELNPVQRLIGDEGATQCGFCTPGFVVSLTGFCLSRKEPTYTNAIASIDGNICRCTGYKSLQRVAEKLSVIMMERNEVDPIAFATGHLIVPSYFSGIYSRISQLTTKNSTSSTAPAISLGGGTDMYVQQHENMIDANINFLFDRINLKQITENEGTCIMGGEVTVTDILDSPIFISHFNKLAQFFKLVSSTPIRNMATIGGNFVNASPIGDMTIFFLALDAQLQLTKGKLSRQIPLRKLYKGYKILDKDPEEMIERILFKLPSPLALFNFEKVSKRKHLDIASVNSALFISVSGINITNASLTAGGVGPIPLYLEKTSLYLVGKEVSSETILGAQAIAQTEISPISDTRGSHEYKRLLLDQLIRVHFMELFPNLEL